MRTLVVLMLLIAVSAVAAEGIRAFPIPAIEALGTELYQRDILAAAAFDTLFAAHPEASKLPIKGWITEFTKEHRRVYFIQERDSRLSLAYMAVFQDRGAPQIEDKQGAELPPFVAERFAARRAAVAAIPKFWAESYNFEVLDAPDGKGFLVYGLAATKDPNVVVVGGHYRVSVSADGKVLQVDALSRSFLVVPLPSHGFPKDPAVGGLTVTHIVSNTPVETHVYVSLLHQVPLFVTTSADRIWRVSDGKITQVEEKKQPAGQVQR